MTMSREGTSAVADATTATSMVPRWARNVSVQLAVAGLLVSAYLTFEHYVSAATLACPDTGVVNCVKVTTSSYAELAGAPMALLGLAFFAAMTALCSPWGWSARGPWPGPARLAGSTGGVVMVVYLVWVELFRIGAICLWCTVVHALTLVLFGLVVVRQALPPIED